MAASSTPLASFLAVPPQLRLPSADWENVPQIIPHTLQELQREVHGLTRVLREAFFASRVIERGFDPMSEFDFIRLRLAKSAAEMARTVGEVRALGSTIEDVWRQNSRWEQDEARIGAFVAESNENLVSAKSSEDIRAKSTVWSINALKRVVTDVLNESELKRMLVEMREFDLSHIDEEIHQIVLFNEKLIKEVTDGIEAAHYRITQASRVQDETVAALNKKQAIMEKRIDESEKECSQANRTADEARIANSQLGDSVQKLAEEMKEQIGSVGERIASTVRRVKKRKRELGDAKKQGVELSGRLAGIDTRVKEMDKMLDLFKNFLEHQNRVKQLEADLAATKLEIKASVANSLEAITAEIKENRQDVYKRLEATEHHMSDVSTKLATVSASLGEWAMKTMQPAQSNEAKIFMLETRVKEEEKRRIRETGEVRDTLLSLAAAVEKYGIARIGAVGCGSDQGEQNEEEENEEESNERKRLRRPKVRVDLRLDTIGSNARLPEKEHDRGKRRKGSSEIPELALVKRLNQLKLALNGSSGKRKLTLRICRPGLLRTEDDTDLFDRIRKQAALELPELVMGKRRGGSKGKRNLSLNCDYRSDRKKYRTFKNYVAKLQSRTPTVGTIATKSTGWRATDDSICG